MSQSRECVQEPAISLPDVWGYGQDGRRFWMLAWRLASQYLFVLIRAESSWLVDDVVLHVMCMRGTVVRAS